jgi:hypothetical protein
MANYANLSSKRDAKGNGKVGASGPPPAPIPVPVPVPVSSTGMVFSAALSAGTAPAAGGIPLVGKSVPPATGTEVAPVQPKRCRLTKQGTFLLFVCDLQEFAG